MSSSRLIFAVTLYFFAASVPCAMCMRGRRGDEDGVLRPPEGGKVIPAGLDKDFGSSKDEVEDISEGRVEEPDMDLESPEQVRNEVEEVKDEPFTDKYLRLAQRRMLEDLRGPPPFALELAASHFIEGGREGRLSKISKAVLQQNNQNDLLKDIFAPFSKLGEEGHTVDDGQVAKLMHFVMGETFSLEDHGKEGPHVNTEYNDDIDKMIEESMPEISEWLEISVVTNKREREVLDKMTNPRCLPTPLPSPMDKKSLSIFDGNGPMTTFDWTVHQPRSWARVSDDPGPYFSFGIPLLDSIRRSICGGQDHFNDGVQLGTTAGASMIGAPNGKTADCTNVLNGNKPLAWDPDMRFARGIRQRTQDNVFPYEPNDGCDELGTMYVYPPCVGNGACACRDPANVGKRYRWETPQGACNDVPSGSPFMISFDDKHERRAHILRNYLIRSHLFTFREQRRDRKTLTKKQGAWHHIFVGLLLGSDKGRAIEFGITNGKGSGIITKSSLCSS